MKPINWNPEKNKKLIAERGFSFEDVVFCLQSDGLLDDLAHPNQRSLYDVTANKSIEMN